MTINEVLEKYQDTLMVIEGVIGIAVGKKDSADVILVQISGDSEEIRFKIPDSLEGYPVEIMVMDNPELF